MRTISVGQLKKDLSTILQEAAAGGSILVTRHKRAVAMILAVDSPCLHRGSKSGRGRLHSVLSGPTGGGYLEVLLDDRREPRKSR